MFIVGKFINFPLSVGSTRNYVCTFPFFFFASTGAMHFDAIGHGGHKL